VVLLGTAGTYPEKRLTRGTIIHIQSSLCPGARRIHVVVWWNAYLQRFGRLARVFCRNSAVQKDIQRTAGRGHELGTPLRERPAERCVLCKPNRTTKSVLKLGGLQFIINRRGWKCLVRNIVTANTARPAKYFGFYSRYFVTVVYVYSAICSINLRSNSSWYIPSVTAVFAVIF